MILRPISSSIQDAIIDEVENTSLSYNSYNNILWMCTTLIDNGKRGGWEKDMIVKDCIKSKGKQLILFPNVHLPIGHLIFHHLVS